MVVIFIIMLINVIITLLMIRLRRTVADRKRLLTKVIEGLGQHGMVSHDDHHDDDYGVVIMCTMMTMMVMMVD